MRRGRPPPNKCRIYILIAFKTKTYSNYTKNMPETIKPAWIMRENENNKPRQNKIN